MIVPMRQTPQYPFNHVFPDILYDEAHRGLNVSRLYTGRKCDMRKRLCGYPCFFNALDSFRWKASEYHCTSADNKCLGLGVKASSYWLARLFINAMLPEAETMEPLKQLKVRADDGEAPGYQCVCVGWGQDSF